MKTIITIYFMLFLITSQAQIVSTVTEGSFEDGFGITSNDDVFLFAGSGPGTVDGAKEYMFLKLRLERQ